MTSMNALRSTAQTGLRAMTPVLRMAVIGIAVNAMALEARATWSIIIIDTNTKEVAIGSATCLTFFDLQFWTPVMVVGIGGATAQSYVDSTGANRVTIYNELLARTPPERILEILAQQDPGHQTRQYGIVDTLGRAITFSGTGDGQWAGGVTGQVGDLVYAIQGNVLTGAPVVALAEQAVLNTPGDVAAKLMAAMEAARSMGGDGRCSCSPSNPTGCGSPPPDFKKSAHVGYMLISRPGDPEGSGCSRQTGCATGDYFMEFNITNGAPGAPDPVYQLQDLYDQWRVNLRGRPDGAVSVASIQPGTLPPDGTTTAMMTIDLLDWEGSAITHAIDSVIVEHESGSARVCTIGPVNDMGGGRYSVVLTAGYREGTDQFRITVDDGVRPVRLIPPPTIESRVAAGDLHLESPTPGGAGEVNDFCVTSGQPGTRVLFAYSLTEGVTMTPCGPIGLDSPVLAGRAVVGANGTACVSAFVPGAMAGRALHIAAAQIAGCERSNVVSWTFH